MSSIPMALPVERGAGPAPVDASPANAVTSPFVSTTTPTIERANRFISLRAHPGFVDLLRLSAEIRDSAAATLIDFGGWDEKQIAILKVRAQAAKEHHDLLIQKFQDAIQAGLDEARALTEGVLDKAAAVAPDQSDYVRQRVLQNFEERDPARIPGSY